MTYVVNILRSAQKQLGKISSKDGLNIISAVRKLAQNPRPSGCKKLSGLPRMANSDRNI